MSNELVKREGQTALAIPDEAKIFEYLGMMGIANKLTDGEKQLFAHKCINENLNPFKGEIYPIVYGQGDRRKVSFITAFHTFIAKAERTGLMAGWKAWTDGSLQQGTLKAYVEIIRKDWDVPFRFDVDFEEFSNGQNMWAKMPKYMLKKCVIGTGFRLCFPGDMAGLYLDEEMESVTVTVEAEQAQTQQAQPEKQKRRSRTEAMVEKLAPAPGVAPTEAVSSEPPKPEEEIEDARIVHSELLVEVLDKITAAETDEQYSEAFALAKKITDEREKEIAREAYRLKKEAEQEYEQSGEAS